MNAEYRGVYCVKIAFLGDLNQISGQTFELKRFILGQMQSCYHAALHPPQLQGSPPEPNQLNAHLPLSGSAGQSGELQQYLSLIWPIRRSDHLPILQDIKNIQTS